MLKEILKGPIKCEIMVNSGILGQLMDLSPKAITSLPNWDGELIKNKSLIMQFFIEKDAKHLFI